VFTNLDRDQASRHITVLGTLVLASGLLGILGASCFGLTITTIGMSVSDPEAQVILPIIAVGIAGFAGVLSCISVAAGYGILRRARWGRLVGLVDAFLGLIWFPIGTIVGLYAFWVLFQAEAVALFEARTEPADRAG
jgi:hypothetical protein